MWQVAGNDPNVGRLVSAVGSYLGRAAPELPLDACVMQMGGRTIFEQGAFVIECAPLASWPLTHLPRSLAPRPPPAARPHTARPRPVPHC